MKKYDDMYIVQDTDGMYVVARVIDGHIELTPFCWPSKDSAERYIAAHK